MSTGKYTCQARRDFNEHYIWERRVDGSIMYQCVLFNQIETWQPLCQHEPLIYPSRGVEAVGTHILIIQATQFDTMGCPELLFSHYKS